MFTKYSPVGILITIPLTQLLIERLQEISPQLQITVHPMQRAGEVSNDIWLRTEVLYTDHVLPDPIQTPNLRWIQLHRSDIISVLKSPLIKKTDLIFTTSSGVGISKVGEYVLMMMLAISHRLPNILSNQSKSGWPTERNELFMPQKELYGSTIGIIGYGSVGREIARLLQPYHVTLLATKYYAMNPRDTGYIPDGLGDPEGDYFHRLYPIQALRSLLKECDFIIMCVPDSPTAQNLIGEQEFQSMKQGAFLINIGGRGVINQDALLSALHHLGGAVLDSFSIEPLPTDSPFWRLSNVIISPHVAGISYNYNQHAMALFEENLKHYLTGTPLLNIFDIQRGY